MTSQWQLQLHGLSTVLLQTLENLLCNAMIISPLSKFGQLVNTHTIILYKFLLCFANYSKYLFSEF